MAPRMCGRYTLSQLSELQLRFGEDDWAEIRIPPSVPIVIQRPEGRQIVAARWGFQPPWIKESRKSPPINARAETIASRPMFMNSVRKGRCLIPADGFYEWMTLGPNLKQPYHIRLRGGTLFAFGGLYKAARKRMAIHAIK